MIFNTFHRFGTAFIAPSMRTPTHGLLCGASLRPWSLWQWLSDRSGELILLQTFMWWLSFFQVLEEVLWSETRCLKAPERMILLGTICVFGLICWSQPYEPQKECQEKDWLNRRLCFGGIWVISQRNQHTRVTCVPLAVSLQKLLVCSNGTKHFS